jgi:hypothetical protein
MESYSWALIDAASFHQSVSCDVKLFSLAKELAYSVA